MIGAPTKLLPGLLIAVVLVAGWRTMASTRQVLGGTKPGEITPEKQQIMDQEAAERRQLERVATEDSLLGALQKAGRLPDPFNPAHNPPPRIGLPDLPPPPELKIPSVVMVIIEPTRQEVILRVGGQESPRLRAGSAWKGWSIVRIDRDVVEIQSQDQKKRYLPVSNLKR